MKHTLTRIEGLMDELQQMKQRLIEIYENNPQELGLIEDQINEKIDSLNAFKMFIAGHNDYMDHKRFLHLPSKQVHILCQIPIFNSATSQRAFVLMSEDTHVGFTPATRLSRNERLIDESEIVALFGATPEFNWELA
jgi:hypothetical protein